MKIRNFALFAMAGISLFAGCASYTAERAGHLQTDQLQLDAMHAEVMSGANERIEAIVIMRDGEALFEAYYGRSSAESRIDAKSTGKSITALAVGIAIDQGLLPGVDVPVWDFLEIEGPVRDDGPEKRAITIGDLLNMSSALDCTDWGPSPGNEERMYRNRDWTEFALNIPIDPAFQRGDSGQGRFSYCTAGAFLLGRVVERASGQEFDEFVQENLFDPLGVKGAIWRRSPSGQVQSGGQLSLRAGDFAAIGTMILNRGVADGRTIVSLGWLEQMLTHRAQATPNEGYGYLWWMRLFTTPDGFSTGGAYMAGNGGNKVVLLPEFDAVIVILSTSYNRPQMSEITLRMIETHIIPALRAMP